MFITVYFYTSIYNNNIRSLCYGGIIGDRGCVLVDGFFITKSLPYGVPLGAAQYNIELYDDSMDWSCHHHRAIASSYHCHGTIVISLCVGMVSDVTEIMFSFMDFLKIIYLLVHHHCTIVILPSRLNSIVIIQSRHWTIVPPRLPYRNSVPCL